MSNWSDILIDIGILSSVGMMYYFYQKRRIIRVSHEAIIGDLEMYRFKLNEFVQSMADTQNYQIVKHFSDQFEVLFQNQDLENFAKLLNQDKCLSDELKDELKALNDQIADHLVSR